MINIKKILSRRRQKKILGNIRRNVEEQAKTAIPDIDIIALENIHLFMVCPLCFDISKAIRPGYAVQNQMCSYCGSEGADISVVSVQKYLQEKSLSELEKMLGRIHAHTDLMEDWKNMMIRGVEKLIELKKQKLQRVH